MTNRLGIEIGGTKLQLGVSDGQSRELIELVRADVDVSAGAGGIVDTIEEQGRALVRRHGVQAVGVGFGGPVDVHTGVVTKSHQISGWDQFPLAEHLSEAFGCPVAVDNDCNVAALGEAKLGAGQGRSRVFYVTVGTGVGGGFVVDGSIDGNQRPAISEIGHLRCGVESTSSDQTIEQVSSGWGIERAAKALLQSNRDSDRLLELCEGEIYQLTGKHVGQAATEGDLLAISVLEQATQHLGWAIASVITLLAPEIVVVGGGVSLIGESFFSRLRKHVGVYVFPPLRQSCEIVPAFLGEEVVVHGALQLSTRLA